jgi:predicted Zn-dependent protease
MVKNLVKIILTVFIVFSLVFVFNNVYKNKDQIFSLNTIETIKEKITGVESKKDCNKILEYSLGSVDKSFGLSRDQFLKSIKEAEGVWEKGAGRDLFNYSGSGHLKINLVFDQRQADTLRMNKTLEGINSDEDKLKAVKIEYDNLTAKLKQKEESFNLGLAQYQKDQAKYDTLLGVYNSKKEPDQETFNELNSQREALKSTLLALNVQKEEFNSLVSQVNTIAGIFNELAKKLNVRVVGYNEVQGAKDEFVSGLYTLDGKTEKIDIFQFYDNKDLVVTIAHELGHALGLGHAIAPGSLMYPKSEGQKTELSKEDLKMLSVLCN